MSASGVVPSRRDRTNERLHDEFWLECTDTGDAGLGLEMIRV